MSTVFCAEEQSEIPDQPDALGRSADRGHSAPAVALRGVRVELPSAGRVVLDIPDLRIGAGETVALIGPSGAGKTTLLRLINGYVRPRAGSVRVFGAEASTRSARRARFRVGYVFQDFALLGRASVFDNVVMGRLGRSHPWLSLAGWFSDRDRGLAVAAIEEVGLSDQILQRADHLSGGQQQRVAIARTLVQEPELILADEPVSNLDPALTIDVLDLLTACVRRRGATLLVSLHQPGLATRYASRAIALRAGRLVFDGAPTQLDGQQLARVFHSRVRPASLVAA